MKEFGILFDYNGVIVDDEHLQREAMNEVLKNWQAELTEDMYEQYCLGQSDKGAFDNLRNVLPRLQVVTTEELIQKKFEAYQKISGTILPLHPGVEKLLQELSQDFRIGLVTGSQRSEMEPILTKGDIKKFFEVIITADDVFHPKPDPEGYAKAISALGLPNENVVVIEDSPAGVAAAKAAGLKCIAVLQTVAKDKLAAADYIINNVNQLTTNLVRQIIKPALVSVA